MQLTANRPSSSIQSGQTTKPAAFQQNTQFKKASFGPVFGETQATNKDVLAIEGLTTEESALLQKTMEAQQKQAEGLVKGIEGALDVATHGKQWLNAFQASPGSQKQNLFDHLSSLYHVAAGRFREHAPAKPTNHANKASQNPEAKDKTSSPKPNAEAFEHYRQVLNRHPDLALKSKEALPFDLGQKAALTSSKPKQTLTFLQNKRNQFNQIQTRIQAEAKQKQARNGLTEAELPDFLREKLDANTAYTAMLNEVKTKFSSSL